jgi:hypothetical protein
MIESMNVLGAKQGDRHHNRNFWWRAPIRSSMFKGRAQAEVNDIKMNPGSLFFDSQQKTNMIV